MPTKKQIKLMAHMLGGKNPIEWYRNYFAASLEHNDYPDLLELEEEGLIERSKPPQYWYAGSVIFRVTEEGREYIK